jgi:hypothetical protein
MEWSDALNQDVVMVIITILDPLSRHLLRMTSKRYEALYQEALIKLDKVPHRAGPRKTNMVFRLLDRYGSVPLLEWSLGVWKRHPEFRNTSCALETRNFPVAAWLLEHGCRRGEKERLDFLKAGDLEGMTFCYDHGWRFYLSDYERIESHRQQECFDWFAHKALTAEPVDRVPPYALADLIAWPAAGTK